MLLKCVFFFISASTVHSLNFKRCDNLPAPIQVDLDECIDLPCVFISGEPLHANITFDAPYDIEVMESLLEVKLVEWLPGLEYPIPKDTCAHLSRGWCPLEEGERATYNFTMKLPPFGGGLSFTIEVNIVAVNKKDPIRDKIACFKFTGVTKTK